MKKVIFYWAVLCLLLWAGQGAFAQESKWRLGLRVSPNITLPSSVKDMQGNNLGNFFAIEKPPRISLSGGLQVTYQFTEKIGLNTGLQVNVQNFLIRLAFIGSDLWRESKISLTMLQIPLALHLRTQELNNKIRVRGIFGSLFHIPVSATQKISINKPSLLNPSSAELKGIDTYPAVIPCLVAGAGIEWDLDNMGTLDVGISYQLPLSATNNGLYDKNIYIRPVVN